MFDGVSTFEQKYKIWMGVITLIIVINSFYIFQILLNQIKYEIELVKELLYLIPDSFIEDKQTKGKKKNLKNFTSHQKLGWWLTELDKLDNFPSLIPWFFLIFFLTFIFHIKSIAKLSLFILNHSILTRKNILKSIRYYQRV